MVAARALRLARADTEESSTGGGNRISLVPQRNLAVAVGVVLVEVVNDTVHVAEIDAALLARARVLHRAVAAQELVKVIVMPSLGILLLLPVAITLVERLLVIPPGLVLPVVRRNLVAVRPLLVVEPLLLVLQSLAVEAVDHRVVGAPRVDHAPHDRQVPVIGGIGRTGLVD